MNSTGHLGIGALPFGRMAAIVQADAEDAGGHDRREQLSHVGRLVGDFEAAEDIARDQAAGAVGLLGGEVDLVLTVAIANDFHRSLGADTGRSGTKADRSDTEMLNRGNIWFTLPPAARWRRRTA